MARTLSNGQVFFDATNKPGNDAWDGMKIDVRGNLHLSGPDGLWIISSEGKHLGTIVGPEHPNNLAWGGKDHKTLYPAFQQDYTACPSTSLARGCPDR